MSIKLSLIYKLLLIISIISLGFAYFVEYAMGLGHMTDFAINYYNDFVKDTKNYLAPNDKHKELLQQIVTMLEGVDSEITGEEIQNNIYAIGREAGYENLRDFFKELYQILLGQISGPRLGSFFKLFGISETIKLINSKIKL